MTIVIFLGLATGHSSKISRDESTPEEWTAGHSGTEVPVRETL